MGLGVKAHKGERRELLGEGTVDRGVGSHEWQP